MKKIFLVLALALCAPMTFAQCVPSYVPTNGLVGYWPFNGNADDMSGNGNHGTVNGATLTTDRLGNGNGAYSFDGLNDFINTPTNNFPSNERTVSFWINSSNYSDKAIMGYGGNGFCGTSFLIHTDINSCNGRDKIVMQNHCCVNSFTSDLGSMPIQNWSHVVYVLNISGSSFYINGVLASVNSTGLFNTPLLNSKFWIGCISDYIGQNIWIDGNANLYNGSLDDIGIWNRALTQEEITQLYYAENTCQSLVINTGVLSFNPPTYNNTVTIFPNPAKDHITIDCGNLANVSGWSVKIFNELGQEVFSGAMNQQQYLVPLNTWSGQGVYFVKIYDASNHLMNTKKIILQ